MGGRAMKTRIIIEVPRRLSDRKLAEFNRLKNALGDGATMEVEYPAQEQALEYGFADHTEPITWVHSISPERAQVERLWGPNGHDELEQGRIVQRTVAGAWEVSP